MACEVPSCDDSFRDGLDFFVIEILWLISVREEVRRNKHDLRLDSKATQSTKEFHTLYLFAKYVLYFCYHFIVAPNSNLYLLLEYYELHHCQVYKSSPVEAIFSRFAVAYCRAC